jgi:drug/metabolite transporter (DMT)-like permease
VGTSTESWEKAAAAEGDSAANVGDVARRDRGRAALLRCADSRHRAARSGKAVAALAALGFGNNALPFALIACSRTHFPGGLAPILTASTPLFPVLGGHVVRREERLSGLKLSGAVAGMAGVASLVGPDLRRGRVKHDVVAMR